MEALKSREQAALLHAIQAELQVALLEAESGNDDNLQRWFEKHRTLLQEEPKLASQLSNVQPKFDIAELAINAAAVRTRQLEDVPCPWPAMIEGANRRQLVSSSLHSKKEPESHEEIASKSDSTEPKEAKGGAPKTSLSSKPILDEKITPKALPKTLRSEKPTTSKTKRCAWLSSSVVGSIAVHIIALMMASTYMIHLVRNSKPKAIIASAVETETISMDAPMEMTVSDAPPMDSSESPMPTLPSFSDVVPAASSSVQLPSSMTGLITKETTSPTENAIHQATNASMSSGAANSVQFFGVKAAGNTFCYVVDVSPSMKKDNAFAAAKAELVRSLSLLKPKQRFYISFFGGEIERLKLLGREEELYPIYATPENLQKALVWIDRVRIQEKGLPPNIALNEAIKMDPDGIFLLFDGETRVDVAAFLRKANRSDDFISGNTPSVPIHTIGFYTQEYEALMKRIAMENNGVYRFVPKPTKSR